MISLNNNEKNIKRREHYLIHKDRINFLKRQWRKTHPEKVKAESKRRYDANKEKMKQKTRDYYRRNPEKVKEASRRYRRNNPEKVRAKKKKWYYANPDKIKKMKRKDTINRRLRLKKDPIFYVKEKIRHRLYLALNRFTDTGKVRKTDEYGIDYEAIINHIGPCPGEFKDYHIDHIIPLSKFNFNDLEQIKIAFCPENHRWLKKHLNNKKWKKIVLEDIPEKLRTPIVFEIINSNQDNFCSEVYKQKSLNTNNREGT